MSTANGAFNRVNKIEAKMGNNLSFRALTYFWSFPVEI